MTAHAFRHTNAHSVHEWNVFQFCDNYPHPHLLSCKSSEGESTRITAGIAFHTADQSDTAKRSSPSNYQLINNNNNNNGFV